jgi:hypothetical protein
LFQSVFSMIVLSIHNNRSYLPIETQPL